MSIPDWWEGALLALAAWRTFQLIAFDDILDRPRRYVTRLGKDWREDGDQVPDDYRLTLADFVTCPYCAGFWITALWWGAWQAWPHEALVVAGLFALHAGMIAGHKLLSSE